ncbi:hypothetical protein JOM56_005436 [Amanita muscaria]
MLALAKGPYLLSQNYSRPDIGYSYCSSTGTVERWLKYSGRRVDVLCFIDVGLLGLWARCTRRERMTAHYASRCCVGKSIRKSQLHSFPEVNFGNQSDSQCTVSRPVSSDVPVHFVRHQCISMLYKSFCLSVTNHFCDKSSNPRHTSQMECRADEGLGTGVTMIELFGTQGSRTVLSETSTFFHAKWLFQGPGLPPSNTVQAHSEPGDPLPSHHSPTCRGFNLPFPDSSPSH